MATRGDRHQPPSKVQPVGCLIEQSKESPPNIAKPDKREGNLGIAHGGQEP